MTRVAITVISFLKVELSCEVAMFPFLAPRPNRVVKWSWHVVARIGERKKHFVRYNQFRNSQWKPRRISTLGVRCVHGSLRRGRPRLAVRAVSDFPKRGLSRRSTYRTFVRAMHVKSRLNSIL